MTDAAIRVGMPLDELIELGNNQPFELINGVRRIKLPTVAGHSEVIRILFRALDFRVTSSNAGEVYSETTFILPDRDDPNWVSGSYIPDVMFFAGDRIPKYKAQNPNWRGRPFPLVPDLVIEVVSPTDKVSELDEKVDAYLADGVLLVWVVDPQRRKAVVYAPDAEQPHHLSADGVLDGGDVLPGFQVALRTLFE
jgi:Uma2 family endonuclease